MSYGAAAALQAAVYQRLTGYPALAGVSIVDAIPAGASPGSFVLIGPEVVTDQSDKSGAGAEHRFDISVISDATGFLSAKIIAAAVSDALVDANLALGSGTLVSLRFQRAVARRIDQGDVRRIDLSFRARIEI
jgi:Ni,Fe-hydrogenase maturation factor